MPYTKEELAAGVGTNEQMGQDRYNALQSAFQTYMPNQRWEQNVNNFQNTFDVYLKGGTVGQGFLPVFESALGSLTGAGAVAPQAGQIDTSIPATKGTDYQNQQAGLQGGLPSEFPTQDPNQPPPRQPGQDIVSYTQSLEPASVGTAPQAGGGLQLQFHLDPDGRTVRDNQNNYVSMEDYRRITGQMDVPEDMLNWSYVQPAGTASAGTTPTTGTIPAGTAPTAPTTPAPATPVQTSAPARAADRQTEIAKIKNELNAGTQAPPLYRSVDEFNRLRTEQGVVQDEAELASIRNEAALGTQELRQLKPGLAQGVSMGGYTGAVSEAERNLNFRLEGLAIREQAVLSRLNSKNAYINTVLKLGSDDYQTALQTYNSEYNKNLQAVQLYNEQLNGQQQDALTGFQTITNLLKDRNITDIDPALSSQLDSLALQAGLPTGVFQSIMQATPDEKVLNTIQVDTANGKDVYVLTQGANGVGLKMVGNMPGAGEQWGEPYNLGGDVVQKNIQTGEIRTAVNVPAGRSSGGGSTRTTSAGNDSGLPEGYPTTGQIDDWIVENKNANPDMPYYELWGQLAHEMQASGINPTDFDKEFWKILHPEGLAGYDKYVKGSTSSNIQISPDMINQALESE